MPRQIPKPVEELWKRYPTVWKAFNELGSRCHEAGPLDEKSRRLVKLALSVGAVQHRFGSPESCTCSIKCISPSKQYRNYDAFNDSD